MARKDPLTTIYVVIWPDQGIVKAGSTILPSRVRKFTNRGGVLIQLIPDQPIETEREILRKLRQLGVRAFDSWEQSTALLGAGGPGFSECFRLDPGAVDALFLWLRERWVNLGAH